MFPYNLKKKKGLYCKDMKWLELEEITKKQFPFSFKPIWKKTQRGQSLWVEV